MVILEFILSFMMIDNFRLLNLLTLLLFNPAHSDPILESCIALLHQSMFLRSFPLSFLLVLLFSSDASTSPKMRQLSLVSPRSTVSSTTLLRLGGRKDRHLRVRFPGSSFLMNLKLVKVMSPSRLLIYSIFILASTVS